MTQAGTHHPRAEVDRPYPGARLRPYGGGMTRTWRRATPPAGDEELRGGGTIAWVGLASTDPDAARTFYAGLFGWQYVAVDTPLGEYAVGYREDEAAGGMMAHTAELAAAGLRPGWTTWFRADDLDAALATADAQGAKLAVGPLTLRARARAAILTDPLDATFGLIAGPKRVGLRIGTRPGEPCWAEMVSSSPEDAGDFYGHVLGWSAHDDPAGYTTFSRGRLRVAGMIHSADLPGLGPGWLPYFAVADCRAAIGTVLRLGGRTVAGPVRVAPGTFAVVADPLRAVFAVFEPAAPAADTGGP